MFSSKKCQRCEGKLKDDHSFCPFCGLDLRNPDADMRDFGMLGKNDNVFGAPLLGGGGRGLGMNDSMFGAIFQQAMKMMEHQLKHLQLDGESLDFGDTKPEIRRLPNGIQIRIGPRMQQKQKTEQQPRTISEDQRSRMSTLPRGEAKADVRRFSDKVVYELVTPGVADVNDIFVSKVESGYEVKAVGTKKVYVNSLPVGLPLKRYFVKDNRLTIEFGLE